MRCIDVVIDMDLTFWYFFNSSLKILSITLCSLDGLNSILEQSVMRVGSVSLAELTEFMFNVTLFNWEWISFVL